MWKTYLQPTKSFKAKTKDPSNVRERIQSLSEAVSGLKQDVHNEATVNAMNFERIEKQHFNTLNSQVMTLKKAFTDLADALVEELDGVREEMRGEIKMNKEEIWQKFEEINMNNRQAQENHHQLNAALTQTTKQAFQHIQTLKANQDKLAGDIEAGRAKASEAQNDLKQFITQLQKIVETNSQHVASLYKEQKIIQNNLEKLNKLPDEISNEILNEKEKNQENVEILQESIKNLSFDIRNLEKQLLEYSTKSDLQLFKGDFIDLEKKLKELSEEYRKSFYEIRKEFDGKCDDIKREQINISDEIIQEIREKSSPQIENRVEYLEELTTAQRRELFGSITSMEQSFVKKQEKIIRAIYQLARHQDLPEALLGL
ncbi:unnamed protein product [Blepharisma stoltei]|uniref:Uncharacterized protein n=1 Tax=Blepharisma stoltei TaxID=1481888 RepID=A0AAU9IST1_9CILI|nr:unnamed protein product [Blepharisma stoltei]